MLFSFLNPALLLALGAVVVPLFLHFLFRKKMKILRLSTTKFFAGNIVKKSQRRKIMNILQLIIRCCIVIVIVLLFAQPFRNDAPFARVAKASTDHFCYVEQSVSMAIKVKGQTLHKIAIEKISLMDSLLSTQSGLYVWDAKNRKFEDVRNTQNPLTQITAIKFGQSNQPNFNKQLFSLADKNGHLPILYYFSDFAINDSIKIKIMLDSLLPKIPIVLVSLSAKNVQNVSLTTPDLVPYRNSSLACTVTVSGDETYTGSVNIYSLGEQIGMMPIKVDAGQSKVVFVSLTHVTPGAPIKTIISGTDQFSIDDTAYATISRKHKEKILLVISDSLRNKPLIAATEIIATMRNSLLITKLTHHLSVDDLRGAETIIISGVIAMNGPLSLLLSKELLEHKQVIFAPSSNPSYAKKMLMEIYASTSSNRIDIKNVNIPLYPILSDTTGTLWRGFPAMREKYVAVKQYAQNLSGTSLIKLSNGAPMITSFISKSGHQWIVSAVSFELDSFVVLAQTGFFLPMIDRLLTYIGHCDLSTKRYAGIFFANPVLNDRKMYSIFNDNDDLVAQWEHEPQVIVKKPGIYRIQNEKATDKWIAIQSDFTEHSFETLQIKFSTKHQSFVDIISADNIESHISKVSQWRSVELFWFLLILLLAFEVMLWPRKVG